MKEMNDTLLYLLDKYILINSEKRYYINIQQWNYAATKRNEEIGTMNEILLEYYSKEEEPYKTFDNFLNDLFGINNNDTYYMDKPSKIIEFITSYKREKYIDDILD